MTLVFRKTWRLGCLASIALSALAAQPASALDTRTYVVSWFTQATYNQEGDCPGGLNPDIDHAYRNVLTGFGKTPAEVEAMMADLLGGGPKGGKVVGMLLMRGRVDGKPVNAFTNPASVTDPKLHTIQSKYAFGFNLDGKGAASPNSFEDPETHEQGVNNQLARALGCNQTLRATPPARPTHWSWLWGELRDSMPAWIITVSGADLAKDGDVTVTFDRALEHTIIDVAGNTLTDTTFRIDPDSRSHNVFQGKTKDGVISLQQPGNLRMAGDPFLFPELVLRQTHMRLAMKPDGSLDGIIGGYQNWHDLYFAFGQGGYAVEISLGIDLPGIYYSLRNMADADPDPTTGQNRAISAAYRIEAVRAFAVQATASAGGTATVRAP